MKQRFFIWSEVVTDQVLAMARSTQGSQYSVTSAQGYRSQPRLRTGQHRRCASLHYSPFPPTSDTARPLGSGNWPSRISLSRSLPFLLPHPAIGSKRTKCPVEADQSQAATPSARTDYPSLLQQSKRLPSTSNDQQPLLYRSLRGPVSWQLLPSDSPRKASGWHGRPDARSHEDMCRLSSQLEFPCLGIVSLV